ncbi:MAG: hypothetical protein ABSF77_21795 [Spirochaetia bacterium]|jgi:hypothetical protein
MQLTLKPETKAEFFWDIFVTACEGGINYWASFERYHHSHGEAPDHEGFFAKILDTEEVKRYEIHRATIQNGLKAILSGKVNLRSDIKSSIALASIETDAGYIDADGADCIVQAGLFGHVIYS